MKRTSGILLPVSSLPSAYGIGCFSYEAYEFIDCLKAAGQSFWQILPLGPTGCGDSPYQSFSTFAGNPYFIDLQDLIIRGWLTKEECDKADFINNVNYIEYYKVYKKRFLLLRKAYNNSNITENNKFNDFCESNEFWLNDYSLFMTIKDYFDGISWLDWEESFRLRDSETLNTFAEKHTDDIIFHKFLQYIFREQWNRLKAYANSMGIRIIGDIPIYVAFDSADTWSHPALFQFEEDGRPTGVAGCPPDAFSATGQLWGNPLYNWNYHEKTNFEWWIKRVSYNFNIYDVIRIDHFRGFDEYYSIPFKETTAINGTWMPGPGMRLFKALEDSLGQLDIIAEDLGFLTPSVYKLLKESGFPGMKVLHFAFDSSRNSTYLPHKYEKNCVVYTGTHDNDTTLGWYQSLLDEEKEFVDEYVNVIPETENQINYTLIRMALFSAANLTVIPMQDYLSLGSEARINTPSTLGDNWKWRMSKDAFTEELSIKIKMLTGLYGRLPEQE